MTIATPTDEPSLTGFTHIGPGDRVFLEQALAGHDLARRHSDAVRHQHHLGQLLVDGDDRGLEPAVGIFEAHQVHHALDGAVLAGRPVKRVEDDIRL